MGKKKIALVDLSQSDTPTLKATGVRSQKLTVKKAVKQEMPEVPMPSLEGGSEPSAIRSEVKDGSEPAKTGRIRKRIKQGRSKQYQEVKKLVDMAHLYPLAEAVPLLRKVSTSKFDASVELHFNLNVDKLAGEMSLPHGTGKEVKVEIASDATLTKLNDGIIDFDVLVAEPKMMGKLAKYAKLLGPKGLMPNPKTGTISDKPQEAAKKLSSGTIRYKSENKAPLMHLVVGKMSFKDSQLQDNIKAAVKEVKPKNIVGCYLCSSMSPSIKLEI